MRAAAIIHQNGQLLFHKNNKSDHYCLVGGRIQIGEDSKSALKREIREELGKEVTVLNFRRFATVKIII